MKQYPKTVSKSEMVYALYVVLSKIAQDGGYVEDALKKSDLPEYHGYGHAHRLYNWIEHNKLATITDSRGSGMQLTDKGKKFVSDMAANEIAKDFEIDRLTNE